MKLLLSFVCLLPLTLISCHRAKESLEKENREIIAIINKDTVYYSDIDDMVKQQIFDELNRIYIIRQTALDETINELLIDQEAVRRGLKKSEYLEIYFKRYLVGDSIQKFAASAKYDMFGINDLQRDLRTLSINSPEGKKLLINKYKKYLHNKLVDSLKKTAVIITKLEPPRNFEIDVNKLNVHYTGNLTASSSLIVVSDFECEYCRKYYNVYEDLFKKYHGKMKLGFVNFSPYISISARAAESAARQGKFWEMHNQLFLQKQLPDTTKVFQIARLLKLNLSKFKSDFYGKEIGKIINDDSQKCKEMGFFATPTVIVNDNVVFNSSSKEEIEELIERTN